jgi:hypothetical protein
MPSIFKKIGKAFSEIGQLWKAIAGIQTFLKCPISLVSNFPLCMFSFLGDILVYFIWYPFFLLSIVFVYMPIKLTATILCAIGPVPLLANLCFNVPFEDYTFPKYIVSAALEVLYSVLGLSKLIPLSPEYLLYRNGSTLKKCYCFPGLKYVLQPLTKKVDDFVIDAKFFAGNQIVAYVFGFLVLTFGYCIGLMYPRTDEEVAQLYAEEHMSSNMMMTMGKMEDDLEQININLKN